MQESGIHPAALHKATVAGIGAEDQQQAERGAQQSVRRQSEGNGCKSATTSAQAPLFAY